MSVKDGGLQQQQRRHQRILSGDALVVFKYAALDRCQRRSGLLSVARHHVECHLCVEYLLRQLLEGKQIHRLLVELVHSLLPVF